MKSSILRAGVVALACALGLSACGGGSGDLYLSGAVSGVTKDGLVLQNNGGDDTSVVYPYTSFQFSNRVSTDDQFNITVKHVPTNVESINDCVVNNGHARANYYTIGQISVTCKIRQRALTVKVENLTTSGLVIINGADRHDVPAGPPAGTTTIQMAKVDEGSAYGVTVLQQPTGQTCTVSGGGSTNNGAGTMGETETTTVTVTCT